MKYAIVLMLFAASTLASATTYYVSSSGDDSANGLTELTAWKTISRVNSSFSLFKPGDKILFKSGDTFYGTIKIARSGTASDPIIIGSYGTGGKPVITGFTIISSWTNTGNGIYSTPLTCESSPEMVAINGTQYAKGRWPNSSVWPESQTWATIDSFTGVTSLTDAELAATGINWTGAELVVRNSTRNIISKYPVTNQSGNMITFSGGTSTAPIAAKWGYFIQNDIRTLDTFGEWFYDLKTSNFYMYFGSEDPANHFVKVATLNNLIIFDPGITYCQLENISLNGVNKTAVGGSWNHNTLIRYCDISSSGNYGIVFTKSLNLEINNCIIDHCYDNGMYIVEECDYAVLCDNTISNIGLLPGMGQGRFESCMGMYVRGSNNSVIEYNKLRNIGYNGIRYSGNNITIKNNYLNTFCIIKEDGGGICYAGQSTYSNMKVLNNIVLNGLGSPGGRPAGTYPWVTGIYVDYNTTGGMEIANNTIANVQLMGGILISGSQNIIVKNNIVFECSQGIRIQVLGGVNSTSNRNISMTDNIIFAKTPTFKPLLLYSLENDFDKMGAFNNNCYARPLDNAKPIMTAVSGTVTYRTLNEWQTLSGQDLNSTISPITLKDTADIDFYINPTTSDKIFSLAKPMIDVKGNKYAGIVTLAPYTSAVLMVDPDPAPVGDAPVYVSSSIPTYPTIMVMKYNMTLANVVPDLSAFMVSVNSVPATIKSVVIDKATVRLYLENGVKYGDIVTVSYNRPAAKPLQSLAGIPAASVSDQPVLNNITGGIPPVFTSAVIPTYPAIMVINYDLTLANIVPPTSAFNVKVNSVSRPVKSIIIYGTTVRLYLETGVNAGDIVTVSYTRPLNNPIQSESGLPAESIIDKPVTNQITGIPPVFVGAEIPTYPTIMVVNYDITLENIVPPVSAFTVRVNSVPRNIKSIILYDKTVRLYLETSVSAGDIVNVSYTRPSVNPLQSLSGGLAASISNQPVTNKIVTAASDGPVLVDLFKSEPDAIKASVIESQENISSGNNLITIFPNPAKGSININFNEPAGENHILKIYDLSGKLSLIDQVSPGIRTIQLQINLHPGIYYIKLLNGKLTLCSRKLLVVK